jgi:hypothetical protein
MQCSSVWADNVLSAWQKILFLSRMPVLTALAPEVVGGAAHKKISWQSHREVLCCRLSDRRHICSFEFRLST